MLHEQKTKFTLGTKVTSLLMLLFVLNLCIQIPVSTSWVHQVDSLGKPKIEKKVNKKFLLEIAADFLMDVESVLSSGASTNLVEKLNELNEDWCHYPQEHIRFLAYISEKKYTIQLEPILNFFVDGRIFPPPER